MRRILALLAVTLVGGLFLAQTFPGINPTFNGNMTVNGTITSSSLTSGGCVQATSPNGIMTVTGSPCGAGGAGMNITRAQIPSTNTGGTGFFLTTGYTTAGDFGAGAPYTCSGQTATSPGAIQDSVGTWCAISVPEARNSGGMRPQWFGGDPTGVSDATAGLQGAIDASYNSGINNVYCNGTFLYSVPLYNDKPGGMRGGTVWSPQFDFLPSSTGGYQPGAVITPVTVGVAPFYANNDSTGYWGFPGSPDATGYGTDTSYHIVSSTASVTYNPAWTSVHASGIVIASFKGASIGTPNPLVVSGPGIAQGAAVTTTGSAPGSSLIVVVVQDIGGNGLTGVTDNATGGANTYTNAVSVDNPTLGGIYIFYSLTGHALPIGGHITVNNGVGSAYSVTAFSVVNATSGLDKTAFVDNTSNPLTNPTVSTGTLSQANEVVFGAVVSDSQRISMGWTEPAGWTSATTSLWSPGAWVGGTSYNAGDHVIRGGILWSSKINSNVGNDPLNELGVNVPLVNWIPANLTRTDTNAGGTFYGPPQLTPGGTLSGCVLRPSFNNSVFYIMGYGNGATLDSVTFFPQGGSTSGYCSQPVTGAGITVLAQNAGSNRTQIRNVAVQHVYYGVIYGSTDIQDLTTPNNNLAAENKLDNLNLIGNCVGWRVINSQGFINNLTNSTIDATTAIWTDSPVGVAVYNGNISHTQAGNANKFTIAGTTASYDANSLKFTATMTVGPDPFLTVNCTDSGVKQNNYTRFDNSCKQNVYNAWTLKTADYGIIPCVLVAYNRGTGVSTWRVLDEWLQNYGGIISGPTSAFSTAILTEINAQTTIWGSETSRTFVGAGITADQVHIETLQPYELVDSTWVQGASQATILRNLYLNTDFTFASTYTPGNAVSEAQFFAAQEFSYIKVGSGAAGASGGNIIIDNLCCNMSGSNPASGENVMLDLATGAAASDGQIVMHGGALARFNFRYPASGAGSGNMTGGNNWANAGSAAFGQGTYDVTPFFGVGTTVTGTSELMRSQGWNSGPFWGVRPAPWTAPCISPTQYVTLIGTLPAFSANTVTYPILWSGQQYKICDWTLTPTVYNAGSTYAIGTLVTSASVTYISRVNGNIGNTPASSPTQWAPFHYGFVSNHGGNGYSFGQNITGFTWTITNNSPFVQVTNSTSIPFFPGLGVTLTGTQGGCTSGENFIIREAHFNLQYFAVFLTDNDGAGQLVPQFGAALCSNTTIGQSAYSITTLN